jgi:hypothetical protein
MLLLLTVNVHNMNKRGHVRILDNYLLNNKAETKIMKNKSAYIRKSAARQEFKVLNFYTMCFAFSVEHSIMLKL